VGGRTDEANDAFGDGADQVGRGGLGCVGRCGVGKEGRGVCWEWVFEFEHAGGCFEAGSGSGTSGGHYTFLSHRRFEGEMIPMYPLDSDSLARLALNYFRRTNMRALNFQISSTRYTGTRLSTLPNFNILGSVRPLRPSRSTTPSVVLLRGFEFFKKKECVGTLK